MKFRLPELQSCFVARCLQFLLWHQPVIQCQKLLQTYGAPETAAGAQAQAEAQAEEDGFTIYTQESNYDDSDYDNSYNDTSYDDSSYNTDTTQDSSLDDTGQENDNTDTGDGSSDDGSSDQTSSDEAGMILPIRLIIPAMTIPVTAQMVLWITLIHGKTMERKSSR